MFTLLIMRHAKSDWDNPEISDFERPLNPRGLKAAPFMGTVIRKNFATPDLIISSPAKRAKQTAVLVKEAAGIESEIQYRDNIYEASPSILLNLVSNLKTIYSSVVLIGHNPGLENFIRILTGETPSMPTAAIAKIDLSINDWNEIKPDCGTLHLILRPKELMQGVQF